jgi:polysaccharide deacetylase family protein (PEP-CTERM system associated)
MNILTFDIEDWWIYEHYMIGNKIDYLPRLSGYLELILELLDEKGIRATFFCLGEVADKNPDIIRKIVNHQHHIGCHSFSHQFLGDATPNEVREDTRKAVDIIENLTGEKVTAYRAPAFSIMDRNKWIFEILAENGIEYDSSIFPAKRSYGGFVDFSEKKPSIVNYNGTQVKEFPVSIATILGKEIAYSGGGYFRMLPYWIINSIVNNSDYVMTYFHIYNFDKDQLRHCRSFTGESALIRYFKNYYGLNKAFSKFIRLINDFNFISVDQADKDIDWGEAPIISL